MSLIENLIDHTVNSCFNAILGDPTKSSPKIRTKKDEIQYYYRKDDQNYDKRGKI